RGGVRRSSYNRKAGQTVFMLKTERRSPLHRAARLLSRPSIPAREPSSVWNSRDSRFNVIQVLPLLVSCY
ncbi:hypothetical protein ACIXK3_20580, partial [Bacteroides fragilis]